MRKTGKWKFAVDRGGTFTDVVGLDPGGEFHSLKLLSVASGYPDASIEGIRRILGSEADVPLPADRIEGIRFGTTVATNALLERKGGRVVLFITKGFADMLEIGYQDRPDIFRLCIRRHLPLYTDVIEVCERMDSEGRVVGGLDEEELMDAIGRMKLTGTESAAVVLLHSWINPLHERMCERVLGQMGIRDVFLSHKTVNLIKVVSRGHSTLVDAYLSTVLAEYLRGIQKMTEGIPIEFMQSSGTLTAPSTFRGKNAVFSGPAGGTVAVAGVVEEKGLRAAIGFDMGGTSTDVSRYDGAFHRKHEQIIEHIPVQVETMDIVTVASGGGSVLDFDGRKMTVGPESAGSDPGPACYGFGGPLTVTDANLITGRLIPEYFPETFGPDGQSPIDRGIVERKFHELTGEIKTAAGTELDPRDAALGFLEVANEKMAMAIKEISVSRGFDIRDHAIVCFGGAGAQHACSIAALLDIDTIVVHPLSSVMSAYGTGLSKPALKDVRTVLRPCSFEVHREMGGLFDEMKKQLLQNMDGAETGVISKYELDLRPGGAESYLTVEYGNYRETVNSFRERYERLFGFMPGDEEIEIVNIRTEIQLAEDFLPEYGESPKGRAKGGPASYHTLYYPAGAVRAPVYLRDTLHCNETVKGPAFIVDRNFTVVVDPGFQSAADEAGIITISKVYDAGMVRGDSRWPDPVLLEVFNNLFMGTAAEMGLTLKNTAFSVNMKERLDFSCAVFDPEGDLVANAPHIPVHLGSMADTIKALIADKRGDMKRGDIYLTNNPYRGGSHLPDVTVVSPVFSDSGELIFFTAARGHHSDVGGTTPGSMPPDASHIDEEGVLIDGFLLVREGKFREAELKKILLDHRYPVRNVPERMYDLRAQIAACHKGMNELQRIIGRYGLRTVIDYMKHIQDNSEYSVKQALVRFIREGEEFYSSFEDRLDDGTIIKVSVAIEAGVNPPDTVTAVINFTGTDAQHVHDNLNAPVSVTRSAVIYVLRSLIDRDMPLNSGCLKPVKIIVPEGTVLNPRFPAPVATGNVETSQRVVDALLGAFGVAAASQGTMNNLLFEVEGESPYYETIAGGSGAMEGCSGASGRQVHMTNTRITDPEILEHRHPGVRLKQFTLRRGSGGKGRFTGGDGVVREITFLKPATISILSERRVYAPYGLKGGDSGARGLNLLKKKNGTVKEVGHRAVLRLDGDDSIIIETPGGGGYGEAVD